MPIGRANIIKNWEVIKAFKKGKEIQMLLQNGEWVTTNFPFFEKDYTFRVKPKK